ncbi:MAG TPA: hypothetical protein VKC15_13720 [Gemmatimonadales bacterium]|nr:hypothetical protein [Gemmatimonadales bacterium]
MAFKLAGRRPKVARVQHVSLPGVHATLARTAAEAGSTPRPPNQALGHRAPSDLQLRLY